jgi:hypothetical protein
MTPGTVDLVDSQLVGRDVEAARLDGIIERLTEGGGAAAFERLVPDMAELFETEDGRVGLRSFVERREARFVGR